MLPHYYDAGGSKARNTQNYVAWVAAVCDLISKVRQSNPTEKIYLVGYSLGASVALAAGSQRACSGELLRIGTAACADSFFRSLKGMPPLLILHGERDTNIPVANARQLIRLCEMAHFTCESHVYADEGHGFIGKALADADARTLAFFAKSPNTDADCQFGPGECPTRLYLGERTISIW